MDTDQSFSSVSIRENPGLFLCVDLISIFKCQRPIDVADPFFFFISA